MLKRPAAAIDAGASASAGAAAPLSLDAVYGGKLKAARLVRAHSDTTGDPKNNNKHSTKK